MDIQYDDMRIQAFDLCGRFVNRFFDQNGQHLAVTGDAKMT